MEVRGKIFLVALAELRLHLQRLDGLHSRDVFGQKGLISRSLEKLPVQPLLEERRDCEAHRDDIARMPSVIRVSHAL